MGISFGHEQMYLIANDARFIPPLESVSRPKEGLANAWMYVAFMASSIYFWWDLNKVAVQAQNPWMDHIYIPAIAAGLFVTLGARYAILGSSSMLGYVVVALLVFSPFLVALWMKRFRDPSFA
ncbi:MAG: hypothetical protein AB202_01425 [Parcubacteria bacterium C7867-007]|nr:MAG: hypothetical protein AB202_01425 [Parcubacteria bacterium C7867-007]